VVSSTGFHSLDLLHHRAGLAYDPGTTYWGQGIGTLVAQALSEFGLTQLGYRRVQATVLDSNLASRRVLENPTSSTTACCITTAW
jgi:ribosomal-protein-alanine N-acetyltransferase